MVATVFPSGVRTRGAKKHSTRIQNDVGAGAIRADSQLNVVIDDTTPGGVFPLSKVDSPTVLAG